MGDLTYGEKLEILSLRAGGKTWEVIAEETHHRKSKVIEVGGWFQSLPWEHVRALPEAIQRLRTDYLEQKSKEMEQWRSQQLSSVSEGTDVLPAESRKIYHNLGLQPSWVALQLLDGPVMSPVALGTVTEEYFEARGAMSGPIVKWRAIASGPTSPATTEVRDVTSDQR